MRRVKVGAWQAAALLAAGAFVTHAQTPKPWPFASRPGASPSEIKADATPPREVPLVEKKSGELSNRDTGELGAKALAINPDKWKHAETENFIVHYRRVTEAQKVVREIEFNIWFVAKTLGAAREKYARRSHVFVFEDEAEWKSFLSQSPLPPWASSFAHGDELFLNIRRVDGSGHFDSYTLAHETTHAVVARLYPQSRWPLWLNEGFAEYMAGASVAARKNQSVKRHQKTLQFAEMPIEQLVALTQYPQDQIAVAQLYQTSEKLVRFIMNELPRDRFVKFAESLVAGSPMQEAFTSVYGDKIKDFATLERRYERFSK